MNKAKLAAATLAVALGLAGVAALPAVTEAHARWGSSSTWHGSRYVEGRIAFLEAELRITEAQLPHWNRLADVPAVPALLLMAALLGVVTGIVEPEPTTSGPAAGVDVAQFVLEAEPLDAIGL